MLLGRGRQEWSTFARQGSEEPKSQLPRRAVVVRGSRRGSGRLATGMLTSIGFPPPRNLPQSRMQKGGQVFSLPERTASSPLLLEGPTCFLLFLDFDAASAVRCGTESNPRACASAGRFAKPCVSGTAVRPAGQNWFPELRWVLCCGLEVVEMCRSMDVEPNHEREIQGKPLVVCSLCVCRVGRFAASCGSALGNLGARQSSRAPALWGVESRVRWDSRRVVGLLLLHASMAERAFEGSSRS